MRIYAALLPALMATLSTVCQAADLRGIRVKAVEGLVGTSASAPDFYLMLIGIEQYKSWPCLGTPVKDARALRDLLFERYHFDASHTFEFFDQSATAENILKGLQQIRARCAEKDSVVIYFAGHGHEDGYWIPHDGDMDDRTRWIGSSTVQSQFKTWSARHILLISDSCFAGDFLRQTRGIRRADGTLPAPVQRLYTRKSRFALTSGGREPVKDTGVSNDHSVFAHFLIEALRTNRHRFLTPSSREFYGYLRDGLEANPFSQPQTPQYGQILDAGSAAGEFVFFLTDPYCDPRLDPAVKLEEDVREPDGAADEWLEGSDKGDRAVRVLVTNPTSGTLHMGRNKAWTLNGETEIKLPEGKHRFVLELPGGDRLFGEMQIKGVNEEAQLTQFGLGEGIFFKPSHIQAAQEGRPVRYSVSLQEMAGPHEVISYVMSLRKTR